MRKRITGILVTLALLIQISAVTFALAESAQTPVPAAETSTPAPTATQTPAENPTESPSAQPTQAPREQPTQTPSEQPTQSPSEQPTQTPSTQPTETTTPTETPVPTATTTPDSTASPTPSIEPSPVPTEDAPVITVDAEVQVVEDVTYIPYQLPQDEISIRWTYSGEAAGYPVYYVNSENNTTDLGELTEPQLVIKASDFLTGRYELFVGAKIVNGEQSTTVWSKLTFELVSGQGGGDMPGGFPGGGFPGGGFVLGGSGSAAGLGGDGMPEDQGFRVVPGEALINTHASGNKDTSFYETVALEASAEPMSQLTLGDKQLDIGLQSNSNAGFTAQISATTLILSSESGTTANWTLNGYALKTLNKSGIDWIVLVCGNKITTLPTTGTLSGSKYGALCSAGCVSADYQYQIDQSTSAAAIALDVSGEHFELTSDQSSELYLTQLLNYAPAKTEE